MERRRKRKEDEEKPLWLKEEVKEGAKKQESDVDWDDLWDQFEERRYLSARRWKGGEDPYRLHAFNQRESERIPSDRAVRDTRHHRFCLPPAFS
ncbi:hypothetical protein BTVI_130648 [Pitangus sulphuratus]|nr:hypothetical protein BTVI_130648 [Pitangus sulphuratus]